MDSKAKQRLTGAVILVALFVLLVPALLTGPARQESVETVEESGLRRYTIDIDSPQSSIQPVQSTTPPEVKLPEVAHAPPAATPAPTPASREPERAQPDEAATTGSPAPGSSAPANSVAAPAPAALPSSPAATPVAAAPASASATPRATSGPAASPAPTPAPTSAPAQQRASAGTFAVQLGTFENRDNANRLVQEMAAKGFAAFVAPYNKEGRELYRVRVGPTRDRAAAEALAAQLKRVGHSGSVVAIS